MPLFEGAYLVTQSISLTLNMQHGIKLDDQANNEWRNMNGLKILAYRACATLNIPNNHQCYRFNTLHALTAKKKPTQIERATTVAPASDKTCR